MNPCALAESPDVELYFYGELETADRARVETHLGGCAECRGHLEDLYAIQRALLSRPTVDAPPAGDWSGFMRRLDDNVRHAPQAPGQVAAVETASRFWSTRHVIALAAMLALVTIGAVIASRVRTIPSPPVALNEVPAVVPDRHAEQTRERALREGSAEHLERSKLVVLGLATRDPRQTTAADWQFERQLAGTLLSQTRLYRLAAQESGVSDVAGVMRDLETVLLEASMTERADRESLQRVQRLITRRDLVSKMQSVVTSGSAGI
jgi:hypothetical protein